MSTGDEVQLVVFRVGSQAFAFNIFQAERGLRYQEPTPLPDAPAFLEGGFPSGGQAVPLVGRSTDRVDARLFASLALAIFALSFALRGQFNTQVDIGTVILPTFIQGAAVSCFFIPLISLSLSGLHPEQYPAATGLNNFARITAGAFGTSIATTFWAQRASLHHAQLSEHITRYDPAALHWYSALHAAGLSSFQVKALINRLIDQQAYTMGALDVFNISALLLVLLIPVVWLARNPHPGAAAAAPSGAH